MTQQTRPAPLNEPAERLRERLHRDMQHGLAMEADIGLDAALREQTRITPIDRERLAAALDEAEDQGDFGIGYTPRRAADAIADIYARLAALPPPEPRTPGEER